jgi:hypothetical protein
LSTRKYVILILFISLLHQAFVIRGQDNFQTGFVPKINYNIGISEVYSLNIQTESRIILQSGKFTELTGIDPYYAQTEISTGISRKAGLNNKLAAGYLAKLSDNEVTHRIFQQFTIISRLTKFRLAHRISADQSFKQNDNTEFRFRYRITGEFPLNGESVDPGESYLKINNEYLNSLQNEDYSLEIRFSPMLGYLFSDKNKIEYGLDYRISNPGNSKNKQILALKISWYIKK